METETYNPTTHLAQLEAEARRKALANPGCPQAERSASFVMDMSPTCYQEWTKLLRVTAIYTARMERVVFLNPRWAMEQKPEPASYIYMLFDASRASHEQMVQLTRESAVRVLDGWNPPASPKPEESDDDPFAGYIRNDESLARSRAESAAYATRGGESR